MDMPPRLPAPPGDLPDLHRLGDLPVRVTAVIGRARLTIGDLARAEPGTVVELDRKTGDPVDILVNNRVIGRGEIVMIGDKLGVTLSEIVQAQE